MKMSKKEVTKRVKQAGDKLKEVKEILESLPEDVQGEIIDLEEASEGSMAIAIAEWLDGGRV